MEDARGLDHLHEKGALAAGDIVLGAHAREDAVHQPDARGGGGDEAPHLGQDYQERGLAHEHALPAHVRPGEDDDLGAVGVEADVIGRERARPRRLDDGMAAPGDLEHPALVHHGAHPAAEMRHVTKRGKGVQDRHRARGAQERQLELERRHALLRAQRAALVLLELGGDVAFRAHEGLAPHVVGGNLGRVGVAHLDGVAEDAIEAHAQRRDAGARALAALQRGDPRLRVPGGAAQLGEVGAPGLPDEPPLPELPRWLVLERLLQEALQVGQRRHLSGELGAEWRAQPAERLAQGGQHP